MKVHITKCTFTDKKKDGTQITNKWGKVSYRVGLKTQEHGDKWVNGFTPFPPDKWEGSEQELDVKEVYSEYSKSQELKFELPRKEVAGSFTEQDRDMLNQIHATTLKILARMEVKLPNDYPPNDGQPPF